MGKTNQTINQTNVVLSEGFLSLITQDGKAETASKKKRGELITKAMNDGIDFTSKTMSKELEVKNLIALRFPKDAQAILKMGAKDADGAIAADHDGTRFNSQNRPMNWSFWTSRQKRILSDLAKAVVARKVKVARIEAGGNSTRNLVERLSVECNKLFNAVIAADVDALPDAFDTVEVIAGFKTVAKNSGFQLVKKSKK